MTPSRAELEAEVARFRGSMQEWAAKAGQLRKERDVQEARADEALASQKRTFNLACYHQDRADEAERRLAKERKAHDATARTAIMWLHQKTEAERQLAALRAILEDKKSCPP